MLVNLVSASESLAHELSRTSRSSSMKASAPAHGRRNASHEPTTMYPLPDHLLQPKPPVLPLPIVVKKPSKWQLSFGKDKGHAAADEISSVLSPASEAIETASNVSNLIRGLNPPPLPHQSDAGTKGRRSKASQIQHSEQVKLSSSNRSIENYPLGTQPRGVSPVGSRSRQPLASSASSTHSNNWRSSMSTTSSAMTSTSAFTRYSNASARSVSTAATSVSSSSWRAPKQSSSSLPDVSPQITIPKNIKSELL
jgi:hypothetical protein